MKHRTRVQTTASDIRSQVLQMIPDWVFYVPFLGAFFVTLADKITDRLTAWLIGQVAEQNAEAWAAGWEAHLKRGDGENSMYPYAGAILHNKDGGWEV